MNVELAIDAVGALHGGAARVACGAANAAIRSEDVACLTVFASPARRRRFDFPSSPKARILEVVSDGGGLERIWWLSQGAANLCRSLGVSHALFLGGGGMSDAEVVRGLLIQQSIPFVKEGLESLGVADRVRFAVIGGMMKWSASAADVVLVQTETMRSLVRSQLAGDVRAVRVVPVGPFEGACCVRSRAQVTRSPRRNRRILYVGNSSGYKNLVVLRSALDALSSNGQGALLVATLKKGTLGPERCDISEIGYVEEDRLWTEYEQADCLVMPSLSETVCLPLVEAMERGLPVVVSDRPYAREVCGPAAVYFDPMSPEDLARAVVEATADTPERESRTEEGRSRAAKWVSPAAYDELIRAVLEAR